jgi:cobalt/nickel transport system permease protein
MSAVLQPVSAIHGLNYISQIDPRARIVIAGAFSVTTALIHSFPALGIALAAAVLAVILSGISMWTLAKRLLPFNALMLLLLIVLPLTASGKALFTAGPFSYSQEGLLLSFRIALQGNAIMLAILALFGAMEINTLGHALSHLRVPDKLSHLLLFTVRYLDVLHREYLRLRAAMKVRGFRPRMDRHTYHNFGNLLGMLLVRGFDRSQRILTAMKCRGFRGKFYLLDHFSFHYRDLVFCLAAVAIILAMLGAEWI